MLTCLTFGAEWHYETSGDRQYYLLKAVLGRRVVGRSHGWFISSGAFVVEKIELERRHRSKGFGTAMIDLMRVHARSEDCTQFVFSGVRCSNAGAIRLYESMHAVAGPIKDDVRAFVISPP